MRGEYLLMEFEEDILKLKGLVGLIELGTESTGKLLFQQEVFNYISTELIFIINDLETIVNKQTD